MHTIELLQLTLLSLNQVFLYANLYIGLCVRYSYYKEGVYLEVDDVVEGYA